MVLPHGSGGQFGPTGLLYAFPPLPLIPQVLGRVREGPYRVLLVAPCCLGGTVQETLSNARAPSTRAIHSLRLVFGHELSFTSSAISAFHGRTDGWTLGRHPLVCQSLKGARRLCPGRILRAPGKDLPLVLKSLTEAPYKPIADADLNALSQESFSFGSLFCQMGWRAVLEVGQFQPSSSSQAEQDELLTLLGPVVQLGHCVPMQLVLSLLRRSHSQLFVCYGKTTLGLPLQHYGLHHAHLQDSTELM
ncbi:hypothetical protein N1851_026852 [Merluccius polli]|uniref:Uncharacterized protein n=1 Tax=Merluccius polli TaxID=89951 RepID=A0AA47NSP1_MERPO|nr:hypothetical protein N1851_026852 [Merluccius polli]